MSIATVATCNLNQWALDFDGNMNRTIESIVRAKKLGAKYRLGPELELCGYGCEDHFLEYDTFLHCWESLAKILGSDVTDDILVDIGMPVMHKTVRYNCRVFCLNRKILLIRPKLHLADDGNYREGRFFAPWMKGAILEDCVLPELITKVTGQPSVKIGFGAVDCNDTCIATETCEELWTPLSPHINLALDGVEIISNGSGSHHQLRKLKARLDLITSATQKSGGVYLYANQQGCDGGRLYFDGAALIAVNGQLVAQGSQFTPSDVEVIIANVDLEDVRSYRGAAMSRSIQASSNMTTIPRVKADIHLCNRDMIYQILMAPTAPIDPKIHSGMEEIAYGPGMWLWDYLRRSGARGFFVPLSGGADSGSVVAIVGSMCQVITRHITEGNTEIMDQACLVLRCTKEQLPKTPREMANKILHTCYMGTSNSSTFTKDLAASLAQDIGCYHHEAGIDPIVRSIEGVFRSITGKDPKFLLQGGSMAEDVALQNIQSRSRMVLAYMLASLLPWVRNLGPGFLLVLATGNVDEGLRGYLTKYDCSSGDINPIGSISKGDLLKFCAWAGNALGYPTLKKIIEAPPTAELRPMVPLPSSKPPSEAGGEGASDKEEGTPKTPKAAKYHTQTDEADMGMTYEELGWFGRLRKVSRCGPVSMFRQLATLWDLSPRVTANKVKHFFKMYAINRHKMTTITPSYHAECYSPDDNRFDLRPFLYNCNWPRQFAEIDKLVEALEKRAYRETKKDGLSRPNTPSPSRRVTVQLP